VASDPGELSVDWRQRVGEIGKRAFEIEEMLRLGFITSEELVRLEGSGVKREEYRAAVKELARVRAASAEKARAIAGFQDVDAAIATIRARRIERVKAARLERRKAKALERETRAAAVRETRRTAPTFLGRGVSHRITFTGGDPEQVARSGLPPLESFTDLAEALGLEPDRLQWLTFERDASHVDHYTRFEIPKRTGGYRLISSPKPALRGAQSWIADTILSRLGVSESATAFRPGLSIVDNAARHAGQGIVIRVDLRDFFPSITFPRVRGLFESMGYNPGVSSVLALLCTDAPRAHVRDGAVRWSVAIGPRSLPQGACTSPAISNLVTRQLDQRLMAVSSASGWVYSRYADDLVFSTSAEGASPHRLIRLVTTIAADEGFEVNGRKTRIMRSPNRQSVTGLVVNEGTVRLSRRDLRRLRAFLHQCETKGLDAVSQELGKDAALVAQGHLAYVQMVSPAMAVRIRSQHPWIR
jgi:RNA-directed DNA polymerase